MVWIRGDHDAITTYMLVAGVLRTARRDDADVVIDLSGGAFSGRVHCGRHGRRLQVPASLVPSVGVGVSSPRPLGVLDACSVFGIDGRIRRSGGWRRRDCFPGGLDGSIAWRGSLGRASSQRRLIACLPRVSQAAVVRVVRSGLGP